jgi:hypothetical protein
LGEVVIPAIAVLLSSLAMWFLLTIFPVALAQQPKIRRTLMREIAGAQSTRTVWMRRRSPCWQHARSVADAAAPPPRVTEYQILTRHARAAPLQHPPRFLSCRRGLVSRFRLLEALDDRPAGVMLVCAPPRYGKTVLLVDSVRRTGAEARVWVNLDRDDYWKSALL